MAKKSSVIRIIGGQLRGRKIEVPDLPGLRPTSDRIRETLFNWLQAEIPAARVLDCFAGAGGLGFEAASREASQVILIEHSAKAAQNLKKQQQLLQLKNVEVLQGDCLQLLARFKSLDVVFIDPPYAHPELRRQTIELLVEKACLNKGALVYSEWPSNELADELPQGLTWVRQKQAGKVCYALAKYQ